VGKGKKLIDILDLSPSLETHAYDLLLKMGRQVKDQDSEEVFQVLAKETKGHLERLSSFFEKRL
jgi:rubrerythrin